MPEESTQTDAAKPSYEDLTPQQQRWVTIKVWAIFGGIGLLLVLCLIGANRKSDSPQDVGYEAKRVCRDFVENRLKAPSTAEFSGESYSSDGDIYTVTGAVDAQNSFGAMLRDNYTCVIRLSGDRWHLRSLTGIH